MPQKKKILSLEEARALFSDKTGPKKKEVIIQKKKQVILIKNLIP